MGLTVSVIVAAYNVERFLPRGLECILAQTYENLEVMIIDDGSTDGTGALLDILAGQDPRIRVFHKKNEGPAVARNYGLERASGEYIVFFDIDDSVDVDWIEGSAKILEATGADMTMHGFTVFDENIDRLERIAFPALRFESNQELKAGFADLFIFVRYGNGYVWNKMYRKEFIDKQGIRFDAARIRQDEPFNFRLCPHVSRLIVQDREPYHHVVYRDRGLSASYVRERFAICRSLYDGLDGLCREWGVSDERIRLYNVRRYLGDVLRILTSDFFHPLCSLTWAEKRSQALSMMRDPSVRESLRLARKDRVSLQMAIYKFCLERNFVMMLLWVAMGKAAAKSVFRKKVRR